jgi:DNA-directed RNA polymerase subunit RPC12/RpoP
MAKSYRCPNCAASLVFDPDIKKMTCGFCGTKISPDDVTSLEAKEGFILGDSWEEDAACFLCENCGAKSITNVNTAATFCPFCGSPSISLTITGGVKPMRMIPFTFGREEAEKAFINWCKKSRLLPKNFTSKEQIAKLTGIYVPFWLFDYYVDVNCDYLQAITEEVQNGEQTVGFYTKKKRGALTWTQVPLDASSHMPDYLMECIEPYNYEQLRSFDTKFLSGFQAENYDVSAEELLRRIFLRVKEFVKGACGEGKTGYVDNSHYETPSAEYVFLPVWFLNYTYHGKTYTFALNGQTGKVAGEQPISRLKVGLLSLGIFALSSCICGLLAFMIIGVYF